MTLIRFLQIFEALLDLFPVTLDRNLEPRDFARRLYGKTEASSSHGFPLSSLYSEHNLSHSVWPTFGGIVTPFPVPVVGSTAFFIHREGRFVGVPAVLGKG
jgi:hypothetical protein